MEKKKLTNSKEVSDIYKIVNTKIKKFSDMNISHNKIANYLKPGSENFNNFISEDDNLKNVDGVEIILKDIVNDIYGAFKDGLLKKIKNVSLTEKHFIKKFENFNLIKDDIFSMTVEDSDIFEHEKALADIYSVSISYIDIINRDIHSYQVNDMGDIFKVCIFTENEIMSTKNKIINSLLGEAKSKFLELKWNIALHLNDKLNDDAVIEELNKTITKDDILRIICDIIGLKLKTVNYDQSYELNMINYYIFKIQ